MPSIAIPLDPNQLVNLLANSIQEKQNTISDTELKANQKTQYLTWSDLEAAGLTDVWASMTQAQNNFETYTTTQKTAGARIGMQHSILGEVIDIMRDFNQKVIQYNNGNGMSVPLNTYAVTALQNLQSKLNTQISGTPIFASLRPDLDPVQGDISVTSIWDQPPYPAQQAGTFVQLCTTYTKDSAFSQTADLSSSTKVEQNVPSTSNAIMEAIGALQIFAFSAFPTAANTSLNPNQMALLAQGQTLINTSLDDLISLRATVHLRIEQAALAPAEVNSERIAATQVEDGIFTWPVQDSMALLIQMKEAQEYSWALFAKDMRERRLISYLGG